MPGLFKRRSAKRRFESDRQRPSAGGASRSSFSYYASRRAAPRSDEPGRRSAEANQPTKPKGEVVRQWYQRFGAAVLAIVLLVCVVSVLQIDTQPRVVILNHSMGYALHPVSDYQATVTGLLHGSLLNSNKITIDTKSVVSQLEAKYPEINDASIVLPLIGHRPTVYIELTQPVLILRTAAQSVVLDTGGRALVTAQSVSDLKSFKLPVLEDQSQLELKVGDTVLPGTSVSFIQAVLYQLAAKNERVAKLVLPAGTEELDVYPAHQSYFVKFNLHESDARQQVGTLLAVQGQLSRQKIKPAQYIDVRLAGRAYYK